MPLSDEDIREILRIIDESDLDELQIETEGFALHVVRGRSDADSRAEHGSADAPARPPVLTQGDLAGTAAPPPLASPEPATAPQPPDGARTIDSPMLGTFYRAESPGAEPFVEVGSRVEPDTIVCIIEVMKMMNSIAAGVSGEVIDVCQENGELVEYGAPLFRVRPA
jgi:acetyl-CoA carboxylase biotin carboxyl carrier protein